MHGIVWRNIVLHFSVLHCMTFHGIVWYYMVLGDWRDTVAGSIAMQCIELLSELAIFFRLSSKCDQYGVHQTSK